MPATQPKQLQLRRVQVDSYLVERVDQCSAGALRRRRRQPDGMHTRTRAMLELKQSRTPGNGSCSVCIAECLTFNKLTVCAWQSTYVYSYAYVTVRMQLQLVCIPVDVDTCTIDIATLTFG